MMMLETYKRFRLDYLKTDTCIELDNSNPKFQRKLHILTYKYVFENPIFQNLNKAIKNLHDIFNSPSDSDEARKT